MRLRVLALGLCAAVWSTGCDDKLRPTATGSIAINVTSIDGQPLAAPANGDGGAVASSVMNQDSAKATAVGPTTKTVLLTKGGATFTGTIDQLPVGSYTVNTYTYLNNNVTYYGRATTVAVTANNTTAATISNFGTFQPTFTTINPSTTTAFRISQAFNTVASADSYKVEVAANAAFTGATTMTPWPKNTPALLTVTGLGTWYVRMSAANATVPAGGQPGAATNFTVTADTHLPVSADDPVSANIITPLTPANPLANVTITLDSLNITTGDADWFSFRDCNGDSVTVTAQAVRLSPPSPLNSVLQVYDSLGRVVGASDNADSTDARVVLAVTTDGRYNVRVSGGPTLPASGTAQVGPVGHYRLQFVPKSGGNNLATSCRLTALPVTSIATMFLHSCAVRTNGNTDCWGNNINGQLGFGTTVTTTSSTKVSGTQVLQAVSVGYYHSCGRTSSGTAYCWGSNINGQLGDNSVTDRNVPTAVTTGQLFSVIDVGTRHSCGLNTSGTAYCWGDNTYGELGNGTTSSAATMTPVVVTGGLVFNSLSAGGYHTCGTTGAGATYCWGLNADGQLGDGTLTPRSVPVLVLGGLVLHGVAAGEDHTCALNASNLAYCWGDNSYGQIGDGTSNNATVPVSVSFGYVFNSLSAGAFNTCGVNGAPGAIYCWGDNYDGQLGTGSTNGALQPALVANGFTYSSVAAGRYHTCAVRSTADAYCWGWNGLGQLGDGSSLAHTQPAPIALGQIYKALTTSGQHSCAITVAGAGWCWGLNASGELGDGTLTDRLVPTSFPGSFFNTVSAGEDHTCALTAGGVVLCWGANVNGQLGDNTTSPHPSPAAVGGSYTAITTGVSHTCGLSGTTVSCWGRGQEGQVGHGLFGDRLTPTTVTGTYQVVGAGGFHTCAIRSGILDCWGYNGDGQLGNGNQTMRNTPGAVTSAVTTWSQVALGRYHTCALTAAGAASCWGYNGNGQVGDGTAVTNRTTPVPVSGSLVFSSISAGDRHTCGVTTAGALYCWGYNFTGELGNGTFTSATSPQQIGTQFTWAAVRAGGEQTCAYTAAGGITAAGLVYCWGNNDRGQLGYNRRTIAVVPQIVVTGPSAAPPIADAGSADPVSPAPRAPHDPMNGLHRPGRSAVRGPERAGRR